MAVCLPVLFDYKSRASCSLGVRLTHFMGDSGEADNGLLAQHGSY